MYAKLRTDLAVVKYIVAFLECTCFSMTFSPLNLLFEIQVHVRPAGLRGCDPARGGRVLQQRAGAAAVRRLPGRLEVGLAVDSTRVGGPRVRGQIKLWKTAVFGVSPLDPELIRHCTVADLR